MIEELAVKAGVTWFDHQVEALEYVQREHNAVAPLRLCLYYKTGAGKSVTGLACMAVDGQDQVLVLAPPSTHDTWIEWGKKLGVTVDAISHAKFRQQDYRVSRSQPIIVDEFHLLGGHGGRGWKKLDTLARHLQAPLILMSATPNYNDAERVYCIQHVLAPHTVKGGYIQWLYQNCETEANPFGMEPKVTGFLRYPDAAAFLSSLPYVLYLPDDLVWSIDDVPIAGTWPSSAVRFGYLARTHRVLASQIEERHAVVNHGLIADGGLIRPHVLRELERLLAGASGPVLVFATHSTVAEALYLSLDRRPGRYALVTGDTPVKAKAAIIEAFRSRAYDVLIGTATLATGTDGLDKVCDTLVILDDTDDDSLRRQLVGRIMPRGADADASKKRVYRLVLQ